MMSAYGSEKYIFDLIKRIELACSNLSTTKKKIELACSIKHDAGKKMLGER